jgi:dipeptidyl aminopeptidase/acylaminoacyl peptidase
MGGRLMKKHRVLLCALSLAVAVGGCGNAKRKTDPASANEKKTPTIKANSPRVPAAGSSASVDKAPKPETTAATGVVVTTKNSYDPSKDPKNRGGFVLGKHRKPDLAADAKKKPLDIAAFFRLARVSSPTFSPDGKQILFVLSRIELNKGRSKSDIYRVDVDGKTLRRMTADGASFDPQWSPDGKSFIFLSTRSHKTQVHKMAIDGGESEQLTKLATGVGQARLTPDGKRLLVVSRVFAEHGADNAANKSLLSDIKDSPFKAHISDELLYRHWTFYKDGRRHHVLLADPSTGKLTDLTPGDFDSPSFGEHPGFAMSPKSDELCYVSNREAPSARAHTTNKDLWVVSSKAGRQVGRALGITQKNKAYDGDPAYSPDGKYIAFRRQKKPGYEADRFVLALYDRKSGNTRLLTHGLDAWVLGYKWALDSKSLVFRAAIKGRFPLMRVDVESGKLVKLALPSVRDYDLAQNGNIVFTHSSVSSPSELYLSNANGENVKRLTFFNKEVLEAHDVRPVEELWIDGAAGKKVHTFIVKPHGFKKGKRYPLIINVHGGPQYQWADNFRGDWQIYPAYGYVVAYFNPHGSIGYGQAYCDAIGKDYGGKIYQDVLKVTDALEKLPYIDKKRVGAMGWSYGGYMMNWLLGHTKRYRAIASMMSVYDLQSFYGATEELWFPERDIGGPPWKARELYRKWSPSSYAQNFSTPTLVITGERDYRVPYTQSLQLFTALRRQQVPARLIVLPNDGHWPNRAKSMPIYYAAHVDWFHRYLGGKPSTIDPRALIRGRAFKGR